MHPFRSSILLSGLTPVGMVRLELMEVQLVAWQEADLPAKLLRELAFDLLAVPLGWAPRLQFTMEMQ